MRDDVRETLSGLNVDQHLLDDNYYENRIDALHAAAASIANKPSRDDGLATTGA